MHFHHKHDLPGCTDTHLGDWPDWAVAVLATIDRRDLQLMTAIQDQIDGYAQKFAAALAGIAAELDALRSQPEPAADFSGLDAALSQAQALVPAAPAEAPVDAPPAEAPAEAGPDATVGGATPDPAAANPPAAAAQPPVPTVPAA